MNLRIHIGAVVIGLFLLFSGCSGYDSGLTPEKPELHINALPVGVSDFTPDGAPSGGMGALGLFNLRVDPIGMTADMTSLRQSSLVDCLEIVDITNFLRMAPCTNCVKIKSVALDADGHIVVSIGIKHPFPAGDPFKPITGRNRADLHVFNVEGIVISNAVTTGFPGLGQSIAGFKVLNADGYTDYLDRAIDDFYPTDATIHPYMTHFDDYSAGNFNPANPMGFASVTDPPPSGNLVMAMGCDYNYQDYVFDIDTSMDFIYAVGCTYALSAQTKSSRFAPEYRVPQHNKKAASEVTVEIVSNNLRGGDVSSTAQIEVHVVDISHQVAVGDALNQMNADSSVGSVTIDVPGIMSTPVTMPGSSSSSGTGHSPSDPLIYPATITNTSGGAEGTYPGLIRITDTYMPGQNGTPSLLGKDGIKRVDPMTSPMEGLFEISEFATYQVFEIGVAAVMSLTLTSPVGGEEWTGLTHEDITWTGSPGIGFIDLYYSKDDFVSDNNLIIGDYANTGTFDWTVPNDPSTTVKVRIVESGGTAEDTSPDYFTIIQSGCNFGAGIFNIAGSYLGDGYSNYFTTGGIQLTRQSPTQYLFIRGVHDPYYNYMYEFDTSNINGGPFKLFDNGESFSCNSARYFVVDGYSIPGIDRIFYQSGAGVANQFKSIDWNGSDFVNNQTLPKADSYGIWEFCTTLEGDLYAFTSHYLNPAFYFYDKSAGYAKTQLFLLQPTTCDYSSTGEFKGFVYNPVMNALVLFCRNQTVSNGGQIYVLNLSGNLIYQDRDIFETSTLIRYYGGLYMDLEDPDCRLLVHAGTDDGQVHFARYSADFTEKRLYTQAGPGVGYAFCRGDIAEDGKLWAPWDNITWFTYIFDLTPPTDW